MAIYKRPSAAQNFTQMSHLSSKLFAILGFSHTNMLPTCIPYCVVWHHVFLPKSLRLLSIFLYLLLLLFSFSCYELPSFSIFGDLIAAVVLKVVLGFVQFTYNEDSNVIVTVTGSASQLRGSEFLLNRQLFLGYRPMGLSRYSACSKSLNRQTQIKLSEDSGGS